jgi:MFS family permease
MTRLDQARLPGTATLAAVREWLARGRRRFRRWREPRPFAGALCLLAGSLVIAYVPLQFTSELLLIGGAFTVIGLLFAALVGFCGVAALARPRLSSLVGVLGILLSTLSLIGALGGFGLGMVLGTAGGVLCYAWRVPEEFLKDGEEQAPTATAFVWQGAQRLRDPEFSWQGEREDATEDATEEDGEESETRDEDPGGFEWRGK